MFEQPEPLKPDLADLFLAEDIQEMASRYFNEICQIYCIQPELILEHHEVETKTTLEYDGRQLLELIQNADDAGHSIEKPKMLIKLYRNQLIVANMGEPFSQGGLISIFHSRLSPKFEEKNQIGNKGLGFRSILNWAQEVRIKSGNLKIGFSEKYSQSVLTELIEREPKIEIAIRKRFKRFVPAIAVLRVPKILMEIALPPEFDLYDTTIIIDLKLGMAEKIAAQLDKTVNAEMMLFLNHLEEVSIEIPAFSQTYGRKLLSEVPLAENLFAKDIALTFLTNGLPDQEIWHLYGKNGTIADKAFELAVAWQDKIEENSNLLHSFFRTDVTFKFPGLLHGTFELSDNRNELIKGDGYNSLLFGEAAELIAAAAGFAAAQDTGPVSYLPMRLAIVDSASLTKLVRESVFEVKLREALVKQTIFPCTRQTYINWAAKPGYYIEPEFAEFLPSERFRSLLIPCENESDRKFVESLNPGKYDLKVVIGAIAEKRKQISKTAYARLIIAVQRYLGNGVLPDEMLYDDYHELLSPEKRVFFPDGEKHQQLPSGIGVQLLNVKLFEALKTEMSSSANAVIIANLGAFNLKEFDFQEIIDALIGHFKPGKTPSANIILLHKHIFGFYQNETVLPPVWKGKPIPVLNRKNKTGFSNLVYFGKDYDQPVADTLFHYDHSRLVAPAVKFEQADTEQWRTYLAWIGVAILPRKKMIDAEESFAELTMRNFDYRKPISGRHFDHFKDFKGYLNDYSQVMVQSVDQIDNLLKHNTTESILAWLDADDTIFALMSKNGEPKNSYIGFNFAYGKETKYIEGAIIPNYLRWKLAQSAWLNTESGLVDRPDKCTTAASITPEFSPLIEKPKLDFDLLRKKWVDRQRAEDILYCCGVHRSVNTFSTAMLYGMLLSLPDLDESGKKARSIYNQLGQNFEERTLEKLDLTDPNYLKFRQEGKVFCNNGTYEQRDQVFYVNDKHLGESVINQFFTIAMDRRRGKDKILGLFGVAPLEKVDITLSKTPLFHNANSSFVLDINQFKPYVYALRQLADTGKERTAIKQAKFSLVTELQVKLVKDAVTHHLFFADYEFLYLPDNHMVYLRAPANEQNLDDLKEDIHFCSAVAEVFSAIIDVDAQRQQIRELYSKSPFGRDLILTAEQDDPQLRKLASARTALDIVIDRKNDFWRAFTRCLARKSFKGNTSNDAALLVY
jgi:hypothetical protein